MCQGICKNHRSKFRLSRGNHIFYGFDFEKWVFFFTKLFGWTVLKTNIRLNHICWAPLYAWKSIKFAQRLQISWRDGMLEWNIANFTSGCARTSTNSDSSMASKDTRTRKKTSCLTFSNTGGPYASGTFNALIGVSWQICFYVSLYLYLALWSLSNKIISSSSSQCDISSHKNIRISTSIGE